MRGGRPARARFRGPARATRRRPRDAPAPRPAGGEPPRTPPQPACPPQPRTPRSSPAAGQGASAAAAGDAAGAASAAAAGRAPRPRQGPPPPPPPPLVPAPVPASHWPLPPQATRRRCQWPAGLSLSSAIEQPIYFSPARSPASVSRPGLELSRHIWLAPSGLSGCSPSSQQRPQ